MPFLPFLDYGLNPQQMLHRIPHLVWPLECRGDVHRERRSVGQRLDTSQSVLQLPERSSRSVLRHHMTARLHCQMCEAARSVDGSLICHDTRRGLMHFPF